MKWDDKGLIAAIVQDAATGVVRMLGWMNADALARTRETGKVWFWSRSRQSLWMKGESSGNTLEVVEIRTDCDRDAVLVRAIAAGPTCHNGTTSCFATPIDSSTPLDDGPVGAGSHAIDELWATLEARRGSTADSSYTASLLAKGVAKINAKIHEESGELTAALENESDARVVSEAADVIYHLLVGVLARDIPAKAIWEELERRSGTSGLVEKANR